jgi:hypothetical protein
MSAIMEKIQEKIEANHPTDPFDLKGLDRTKEVCENYTVCILLFSQVR